MKATLFALVLLVLLAQGAAPAYGRVCWCEKSTHKAYCKIGKPTKAQQWVCQRRK